MLRRPTPEAPPTEAIVAGLAGAVFALIAAWLGGELVSRLGVGVDDGAASRRAQLPVRAGGEPGPWGHDRRAARRPRMPGAERRLPGAMR